MNMIFVLFFSFLFFVNYHVLAQEKDEVLKIKIIEDEKRFDYFSLAQHPLILLIGGAAVSSIIIPYFTRKWQNHQKPTR